MVSTKNPLQLKFSNALWSAKMIGELIHKKYNIQMRACMESLSAKSGSGKEMVKKEYPSIRSLAKKMKAKIYFGDEAGVR